MRCAVTSLEMACSNTGAKSSSLRLAMILCCYVLMLLLFFLLFCFLRFCLDLFSLHAVCRILDVHLRMFDGICNILKVQPHKLMFV